jgi:uncharacterized phiE125 gp8 family phage protein
MLGQAIRILPPAALPVSLAEFKAHLRYAEADEDAILVAYLRAATEAVENFCGLSLITSTWTESYSAFPTTAVPFLKLSRRPVQDIISIDYLDSGGVSQVLSPMVYSLTGVGADRVAGTVRLAYAGVWPAAQATEEAVTVTYRAGFGDDHNAVPELIRYAILLMAATMFGFREDVTASNVSELPWHSRALLRDWRPVALA